MSQYEALKWELSNIIAMSGKTDQEREDIAKTLDAGDWVESWHTLSEEQRDICRTVSKKLNDLEKTL